jgi:hypothetical protein
MQPLLTKVIEKGTIKIDIEPPQKLREKILSQLEKVEL